MKIISHNAIISLFLCLLPVATQAQLVIPVWVYDINRGLPDSNPMGLTKFNDTLFFYANDGNNGQELWKFDRNLRQPVMVANTSPDAGYNAHVTVDAAPMATVNNQLYFWATDKVHYGFYSYNSSVSLQKDLLPLNDIVSASQMTTLSDTIYFAAVYNYGNSNLWYFIPAKNETKKATNLPANNNVITAIGSYKSKVYFTSKENNIAGFYVYDPSTHKTMLISNVYPGTTLTDVNSFTVIGGYLYFYGKQAGNPSMLYSYDGVNAPRCISCTTGQDIINAGTAIPARTIAAMDSSMYYVAKNSSGHSQLVKYTPTTQTTKVVHTNPLVGRDIKELYNDGDELFFQGSDSVYGAELWNYTGRYGARRLWDIAYSAESSEPAEMIKVGSVLFFTATGNSGRELYSYQPSGGGIADANNTIATIPYPNPTTNNINIDINLTQAQTFSVSLTDAQGRVVYQLPAKQYAAGKSTVTIRMQQLAAGTYFYRLTNNSNALLASGKLVKQ